MKAGLVKVGDAAPRSENQVVLSVLGTKLQDPWHFGQPKSIRSAQPRCLFSRCSNSENKWPWTNHGFHLKKTNGIHGFPPGITQVVLLLELAQWAQHPLEGRALQQQHLYLSSCGHVSFFFGHQKVLTQNQKQSGFFQLFPIFLYIFSNKRSLL